MIYVCYWERFDAYNLVSLVVVQYDMMPIYPHKVVQKLSTAASVTSG